jgi:hypothetical protein
MFARKAGSDRNMPLPDVTEIRAVVDGVKI